MFDGIVLNNQTAWRKSQSLLYVGILAFRTRQQTVRHSASIRINDFQSLLGCVGDVMYTEIFQNICVAVSFRLVHWIKRWKLIFGPCGRLWNTGCRWQQLWQHEYSQPTRSLQSGSLIQERIYLNDGLPSSWVERRLSAMLSHRTGSWRVSVATLLRIMWSSAEVKEHRDNFKDSFWKHKHATNLKPAAELLW